MTHLINEQQNFPNKNLECALQFAGRGIPVLPVHNPRSDGTCSCEKPHCSSVGKHPWTVNGYKDATIDSTVIKEWFTKQPNANLGWRLGELPSKKGSIICLDIDPRNGGEDSLKEITESIGELPKTWTEKTGGNGVHLYYFSEARVKSATPKDGIDLLSDGKIVVVSPSLHRSGKRNSWLPGLSPEETSIARYPDTLRDFLETRTGNSSSVPAGDGDEFYNVIRTLPFGIKEGDRNKAITRIAGHLMALKVNFEAVREILQSLNQTHVRPPLHTDEVDTAFASIRRLENAKRSKKGGAK
jgi:hypothetical protein